MPRPARSRRAALPVLALVAALAVLGAAPSAGAENFTGRQAPDISLADGVQGLPAGDSLARHRGNVVLLTFWFRDCPICRRHLPQVQALHDRYDGFGLDVVTVVDKYAPSDVLPVLRQFGWTFPTAADRDGSRARAFGVGRRPEEYLIAPDGRVVSSLTVRTQEVEAALAGWRVERCGPWPAGSEAVRRHVAAGAYGEALKVQGTEAGLAARVLAEARRDLQARVARIRRGLQRRADVRADVGYLRTAYQGTSLAEEAQAALQALFPGKPR
ncbi:MAG: TlpA family protein disulfide reductase [Planctomycetota bacterium]